VTLLILPSASIVQVPVAISVVCGSPTNIMQLLASYPPPELIVTDVITPPVKTAVTLAATSS
jgi:hypothetical protein